MSDQPTITSDHLTQATLARAFSDRGPVRRIKAVRELDAADGVPHESDASTECHAATSDAVTTLLAGLPPDFVFRAAVPAVGRLTRPAGPPDGPVAVTGTDVAHSEGDLVRAPHMFLDPASN